MSLTTRIGSLALAAAMAGMVVGCSENTDQPDIGEGFQDITDGTSTGDETTDTSATDPAPAKPAEQVAAEDALKDRRNQLHAADRTAKKPLKAE